MNCIYLKKNGLCKKTDKAVELMDLEDNIACPCIEHDIMRILPTCEYYTESLYDEQFKQDVLNRVRELKQSLDTKELRSKTSKAYSEDYCTDFESNAIHMGNLVCLLYSHNFQIIPKEVRKRLYECMSSMQITLDKDMKLDKNKIFKRN